ncbi:MAG TPA: DnaB-like helicase N-terminal domain-containing protein, partial [Candidatus Binatus sp.]|nr:DnaB-like helicase N-terminal domain-containing protein [Candidatus Binatus sp.]
MAALEDNLRKVPPQNLEAESSVLGGVLLDNEAINQVLEVLRPEDFYRESHRKICRAMIEITDRGEPVDLITLSDVLKGKLELEAVGGSAYLASLADFVPTAANISYYAKIVREKAILRSLISTATEIATRGYEEQGNVDEFLDAAEKVIFDISEKKIKASFVAV